MFENLYVIQTPDSALDTAAVAFNIERIDADSRIDYANCLDWAMRRFKTCDPGAQCLAGIYRDAAVPRRLLASAVTVIYDHHPAPLLLQVIQSHHQKYQDPRDNNFVQVLNNAFEAHLSTFRRTLLLNADGIVVDALYLNGDSRVHAQPLNHVSNGQILRPENAALAKSRDLTHYALQYEVEWEEVDGTPLPRLSGRQYAVMGGIGLSQAFVPSITEINA